MKIMILPLLAIFVGCASSSSTLDLEAFSVVEYEPRYASGFCVVSDPSSGARLLKILKPWQGAAENNHHLLMVSGGEVPPVGYDGALLDSPARRVVALSSSSVAMFDAIERVEAVVGVSGIEYISNRGVQESFARGQLLDIGYGSNLNFEAIMVLRPDLVILYGVAGEDVGVTSKLRELGIQYIYVGDYAEESPLGKAEWLVAIAQICGDMEMGVERFGDIEQRYVELRDSIGSAQLLSQGVRPRVMLNTPYRDIWYMPSSNSYMVRLIEDAGGDYIYDGNATSSTKPISLESAYTLVAEADVWLNLGASTTTAEALSSQNPLFAEMDVVERGEIYNTTARMTPAGGSDFWETGVVRPDLVLGDLAAILRRDTTQIDSSLYFYRRLR
ncbi:MAG: ABC transporter substrate-binding protein [Rikenellaceae bacterium]